MPLKRGTGRKTLAGNIAEFHHGNTYARTEAEHGKAAANRQAVAVAYSMRRRSQRKRKTIAGG